MDGTALMDAMLPGFFRSLPKWTYDLYDVLADVRHRQAPRHGRNGTLRSSARIMAFRHAGVGGGASGAGCRVTVRRGCGTHDLENAGAPAVVAAVGLPRAHGHPASTVSETNRRMFLRNFLDTLQ